MPGIPQRVLDMISQLEALQNVKPRSEEEAEGLRQARTQLMNQMEEASERSLRSPGETSADGFTGRLDGQVIDAPWRGEFDMPGNFERNQRMANSLAQDAALREGLGYNYQQDPSGLTKMDIGWEGGLAGAAYHAGSLDKGPKKSVYYSSPELAEGMMKSPWNYRNWDPSGAQPLVLEEGQDRANALKTKAWLRQRELMGR